MHTLGGAFNRRGVNNCVAVMVGQGRALQWSVRAGGRDDRVQSHTS